MTRLSVNTNEVLAWQRRLNRMHRSGFPVAIRETINSAAFDMKGGSGSSRTIERTASGAFTQRQKNFFRATSRVQTAKGFDIKRMEARVGFTEAGLKGGNNFAVNNLKQQEEGGRIGGRTYVPLRTARVRNRWGGKVRAKNRLSKITNVKDAKKNTRGRSDAEKFVRTAIAATKGGYIEGTNRTPKGHYVLFRVNKIGRKRGKILIGTTPLYAVRSSPAHTVSPTNFMRRATMISAETMPDTFVRKAERQARRLMYKRR